MVSGRLLYGTSLLPTQIWWLQASTTGSSYTTNLAVYPSGSMTETACTVGDNPVSFQATAGQTYQIMIAAVDGGPYPPPGGYGGSLSFSLNKPADPVAQFDYCERTICWD